MIAVLIALSLSGAPAPPAPAPMPAAKPAVDSPQLDEPSPSVSEAQVVQLQAMYEQTCGQKAYAAYDDLCETLKKQIDTAQRAADRASRKKPPVLPAPTLAAPKR